MSTGTKIVVGFDGSHPADLALRWALDEARRRKLPVELLHACPVDVEPPWHGANVHDTDEVLRRLSEDVVAEGRERAREWAPDVAVTVTMVAMSPAPALLDAMGDAALVVTGSRGLGGFSELLVGSTSLHVATHATVPVVVVRASEHAAAAPEAGRVVVGAEIPDAHDAVRFGFEEAALRGCGITVVHAWTSGFFDSPGKGAPVPTSVETDVMVPELVEQTHRLVEPWLGKYPEVDVRERLVHGNAARALLAAGVGADLLVVGSRGRGGFASLLLGSVSHAVLHHATCPVAVVRPWATA